MENCSLDNHNILIDTSDESGRNYVSDPKVLPTAPSLLFEHDEALIAPQRLSRYLVLSAHLLLVTASVALYYAVKFGWQEMYGSSSLSFLLYMTSVAHWRNPRFDSMVRAADIFAVVASVAFASYVASTLGSNIQTLWFTGIGVIACIFAANEYKYYCAISRGVQGAEFAGGGDKPVLPLPLLGPMFAPTLSGSQERENVYRINVFVHLFCVHGCTNALAIAVMVLGHERMAMN